MGKWIRSQPLLVPQSVAVSQREVQVAVEHAGLFEGLENPFIATRYHSLVVRPGTLSDDFAVTAWTIAGRYAG